MKFSSGNGERIRIIIGDAHFADRRELRQLLSAQPDIELIGGSAVARILKTELPDVRVMVLRN